jgi:protein tyrosine phosphatase (PTP) superfamily phosphohydrolase (DUF442 family)
MRTHTRLTALAAAALLSACTGARRSLAAPVPIVGGLAQGPVERPVRVDMDEPVQNVIARSGSIYIAGQPSEAALRALVAEGVTVVVNLRTPEEMADRSEVPFDEAVLVRELGAEYVHVPLGGPDHPATPEKVDRVARALAAHPGRALLHCTVAARASNMWAAYLVRHRGVAPARALEDARLVYGGRPMVADLLDAEPSLEPRTR